VTFDRSNNNVGIAIFGDRLYLAIRSAPHHYPGPPLWSAGGSGATRLYLVSTPFGAAERERLLSQWPDAWKEVRWRLEFEAAKRPDNEQLQPLRTSLSKKQSRQAALKDIEQMLGPGAAQVAANTSASASTKGYLNDHDLREPLFFVVDGRLHFLFLSIAGVAHRFNAWFFG
jgi:hypothetical protein